MVDFAKTMAGTAVGIGSLALVGESMKMIPDMNFGLGPKGRGKKKRMRQRKPTPIIKGATNLMIGTALLGGAAGIVNKM
jgi:hypothetical protein